MGATPTVVNTTPGVQLVDVKLAGGGTIQVQGPGEQAWFDATRDKYRSENRFTAVTDVQDLDRLLVLELMVHRWTLWISSGWDYDRNYIDDAAIRRSLRDYSTQITALKDSMGLAKAAREKEAHDSVGNYIRDLQIKAKQFGINREKMSRKALDLMMELSTIVGTYDRADTEERRKLGFEDADEILQWIRETMLPEFHRVDAEFRKTTQRYFVGTI